MTIFFSACDEEGFTDDGEYVRRIDGSVRLVYGSLICGRGFSGKEELLFNMGLLMMFSKTYKTYAGFLNGQLERCGTLLGGSCVRCWVSNFVLVK